MKIKYIECSKCKKELELTLSIIGDNGFINSYKCDECGFRIELGIEKEVESEK